MYLREHYRGAAAYGKKNPEICPCCDHVIFDDDQEYCNWCGMNIEKEEILDNKKSSGSCLGNIGTVLFIIILIILLVLKK